MSLLADLFHEIADQARRAGDDLLARRCHNIEVTLFVIGLGIDAACPW